MPSPAISALPGFRLTQLVRERGELIPPERRTFALVSDRPLQGTSQYGFIPIPQLATTNDALIAKGNFSAFRQDGDKFLLQEYAPV